MAAVVRTALLAAVLLTGCASVTTGPAAPMPTPDGQGPSQPVRDRPLALVYRGPAGCPGCSEPVAALLRSSPYHFRVRYVGPREALPLRPASFSGVALYAQPGGDTSTRAAARALGTRGRRTIAAYVRGGGHYLGICQGAYLAGSDPGMNLLAPGNAGQYIATRGATTRSYRDTVLPIRWGDRTYQMYFQDGAYLTRSRVPGERVLARYTNGRIAALVRPVGAGRVGVVGPHPEAPPSWYREAGLGNGRDADGPDRRLGHQLVAHLMG